MGAYNTIKNKENIVKNKKETFKIELTREEKRTILFARKKKYIRQYNFLLERHLEDSDGYQYNHALMANLRMFAETIVNNDKLLEHYKLVDIPCESCGVIQDFSSDDIPF